MRDVEGKGTLTFLPEQTNILSTLQGTAVLAFPHSLSLLPSLHVSLAPTYAVDVMAVAYASKKPSVLG